MLKLEGICKKYGKVQVLEHIDLQVKKGEIFGLVGPNGAGKTTTLKIMAGLLKADTGKIWLDHKNIYLNHQELKLSMGYMPDIFGVYDNLKVSEYLHFYADTYGIEEKRIQNLTRQLLELVELSDKEEEFVDHLSRGMKQRLCLARALIHDPQILILDEPASGLDPLSRQSFKDILKRLKEQGKTIIISSHILMDLAEICDGIAIMRSGQIVLQGSIEEILEKTDNDNPILIRIVSGEKEAIDILKKDEHVHRFTLQGNTLLVYFNGDVLEEAELLKKLINDGVGVRTFVKEQANLEAIYLKYTQKVQEEME